MQQALKWLADNWLAVSAVLSVVVQISPIKCNPWSRIFGWIGKVINAELIKKVEAQDAKIDSFRRDMDENEKDRIRYEVLSFANECRRHIDHTKEEFDHIISLKAKYEAILKRTDDKNGVFDADYQYIIEIYNTCLRENSFL